MDPSGDLSQVSIVSARLTQRSFTASEVLRRRQRTRLAEAPGWRGHRDAATAKGRRHGSNAADLSDTSKRLAVRPVGQASENARAAACLPSVDDALGVAFGRLRGVHVEIIGTEAVHGL